MLNLIVSLVVALFAAAQNAAPVLEVLGVALETEVSGGTFDDSASAADATKTKLVVVTAKFPRGFGYSTKELVLEHKVAGKSQKQECGGYAPLSGRWMFIRKDRGMSALDFFPGGDGTIDLRLLFAVPVTVTQATLMFKDKPVGQLLQIPAQ